MAAGQYAARKEEKVADKKLSIKEVIENLTEYDMKKRREGILLALKIEQVIKILERLKEE